MHIKYKQSNIHKIVIAFVCMLLFSIFSKSVVQASNIEVGGITFGSAVVSDTQAQIIPEIEIKERKIYAKYEIDIGEEDVERIVLSFSPSESAVYSISVYTGYNGDMIKGFYHITNDNGENARLAAVYNGKGKYTILNPYSSTGSKQDTAEVVLENKRYNIDLLASQETIVVIEKRNIGKLAMAATNITAEVVTNSIRFKIFSDVELRGKTDNLVDDKISENLENYNDKTIRIVDFDQEALEEYVFGESVETDPAEAGEQGGWLEGILADMIIGFVSLFQMIAEELIKPNVELTIDNIIFNRFDQTVIDLTPFGGINVSPILENTADSVFVNSRVGELVNSLFGGLKTLAIAVYIVMLLYIGVKILLNVGGKDQKKYVKYLEYWVTGILFLNIIPYFLPMIPAMSNALIALMEDKAQSMINNFTAQEIVARLGGDYSYLGEDAEIVELREAIDERIAALQEQQTGETDQTREEAQANIDAQVESTVSRFHNLDATQMAELKTLINNVVEFVNTNYDNWKDNEEVQNEYEELLADVREYILTNASTEMMVNELLTELPAEIRSNTQVYDQIKRVIATIKRNPNSWLTNSAYASQMYILRNMMEATYRSNYPQASEYYDSFKAVSNRLINDLKTKHPDCEEFTELQQRLVAISETNIFGYNYERCKVLITKAKQKYPNEPYLSRLENVFKIYETNSFNSFYIICSEIIEKAKDEYANYTQTEAFTELEKLFEDYKNAVIQDEISDLEEYRRNIAEDIMSKLKIWAQEKNRVVYAIAYAILFYQMFAILFMYYKRIFVIIILIIIFPLIMIFYVIDKMGDGKAQSLTSWFKEFMAVVLVQVLHAAIYIVIVNVGIDICNTDSSKWFILILTVCFLFPAERMLRGILNLNSSTLGELRGGTGALVTGSIVAIKMAKNGKRAASEFKEKGGFKGMIDNISNAPNKVKQDYQAEVDKDNKKKKRRSDLEESKKRIRAARQQRIADGSANMLDKVAESASNIKDAAGNAIKKVPGVNTGIQFYKELQNSKLAKRTGAFIRGTKVAAKYAGKGFKLAKNVAQKGIGITMGTLEGFENFSKGGSAIMGFSTARDTARRIGGFRPDRARPLSRKKNTATAPSRYQSKYNNGQKVSGTGAPTSGNVGGRARGPITSRNSTQAQRVKLRQKVNTKTTVVTQTNTTSNTNGKGNNNKKP